MSKLPPKDRAHTDERDLASPRALAHDTRLENVLITERIDPVRSPGAIAPHVHTGSSRGKPLQWMLDLIFHRSRRWQ